MARGSKKRQQDPAPFDKPVRKDATVRSGGKRKRVDASGKVIKPASKGPKIATSKSRNAEEGSEGSEDEGLDAARAAFFDQEDLDEDGQGGFDGLEQSDEMQDGSELGSEEEEEQDEFSELGDDPLAGEDSPHDTQMTALPRLPSSALAPAAEPTQEEEELMSEMASDEARELLEADSDAESVDLDLLDGGEEHGEDTDEAETGGKAPVAVSTLKARMASAVRALQDWKNLGQHINKSRSDVKSQFISDVCDYYGYNAFLAEKLIDLFPIDEAIAFLDASDTPRPITIRVNTLKTRRRELAQSLINRGVNLEPIGKWTKVGLQVFESQVPIGATPEYLAGHYILQAASSFLPVIALDPQPGERVLDMSSAPGGKTTHIAAQLQNSGVVFANDSSKQRSKALSGNVARMGCKNVVICNYDGRDFPKVMGGFDRVLLDAPCSGTGVISKDASVKTNKTERDFMLLSHLQKQLILCAIDSVKPGGIVVYSTCSVTVEENEAVVAYALSKRPHAQLVDTTLDFGREGFKKYKGKEFGDKLKLTRRFFPHVTNMDGFYVSKFHVGKPQKQVRKANEEPEATPSLLVDGEDVEQGPEQEVKFDDEEDQAIIDEGIKKSLKRKGIKPVDKEAGMAKKKQKKTRT